MPAAPRSTASCQAEALSADPKNRDLFFKEWSKSGTPFLSYKRDFARQDLRKEFSPVLDEEFVRRYKLAVSDIKKFKYTKKDVDVDTWFEPKYVNQAIKEQKLENFWKN